MNDELKGILKDLECASGVFDYIITPDSCTLLLDYITNLQQEYEKMSKRFRNCRKIKDNYKSRCKKAIEYIERNPLIWRPVTDLEKIVENPSSKIYCNADEWIITLLNILNGDSDE